MTRSEEHFYKNCIDAFSLLPISAEQIKAIENYLLDEGTLAEVEKFPKTNLENEKNPKLQKILLQEMHGSSTKPEQKEHIRKIFDCCFAVGGATARHVMNFNFSGMYQFYFDAKDSRVVSVLAEELTSTVWRYREQEIGELLRVAQDNPEMLKEAGAYQIQQAPNARILLRTLYMLLNHGEYVTQGGAASKAEEKGGLLQGISKLFGQKEETVLNSEEQKMLAQNEEQLIGSLVNCVVRKTGSSMQIENVAAILRKDDSLKRGEKMEELKRAASGFECGNRDVFLMVTVLSYLNSVFSEKLRNLVRFLIAVDYKKALESCYRVGYGLKVGNMDFTAYLNQLQEIFAVDSQELLQWAVQWKFAPVLREQLKKNRDLYVKMMEKADSEHSDGMLDILAEEEPVFYQEYMNAKKTSGDDSAKEKVVAAYAAGFSGEGISAEVADYLRGKEDVSVLYPVMNKLVNCYGGYRGEDALIKYIKHYNDKDVERRLDIVKALKSNAGFFIRFFHPNDLIFQENVALKLFEDMEKESLDWRYQVNFAAEMLDSIYRVNCKPMWHDFCVDFFENRLKNDPERMKKAFSEAGAQGRSLAIEIYDRRAAVYKNEILSFAGDTSKQVKEQLLTVLESHPEWDSALITMLKAKKVSEREMAVRVLGKWNAEKKSYTDCLMEAMNCEKNAKLLVVIQEVMKLESSDLVEDGNKTKDDLVKDIHKGGKKKQLAWIYDNAIFSTVHKKDGTEAGEEYLQAICLYYQSMEKAGVNATAKLLAEELTDSELAVYANEVFEKWIADGAQAKKRWVLYYASIHGGSVIVDRLKHYINEWPQNSRGAIAAEAVKALALNPLPQALLTVDGISRKFKFRQVKDAAGQALEYAAQQLGLTREELADRIVPDLGFDEKHERKFDYGERSFTVAITPALEMEITDENGKKVKNLPAPGKKDDEAKATAAYEEFKLLKKQMKTTVASQRSRLELALSAERLWKKEDWEKLFVKNPIMHQFAIGLIWGVYENHELKASFRYMEDGSFNTADEEEYDLPEEAAIGLVHPVELSEELMKAWKEQLSDYEIKQPFEQLERPVYYKTEEEKEAKSLDRFGGMLLSDLSLSGKLLGMGWYRGSIQDAGGFYDYYREDPSVGLGVDLDFSGGFVGGYYDGEDVTVYEARFYKIGAIVRGSYQYDEINEKNACPLSEVPDRYFSEIVLQLTKATASSQERDENWRQR